MKFRSWLIPIAIFVVILGVGMVFAYPLLKKEKTLKIYQPSDVNPKLVDTEKQKVKADHTIADFSLINQEGRTITQDDFAESIYVADFFFATCPSICPIMSGNIAKLQEEFKNEKNLKFLSHSVTPEMDSVSVLADYGELYGADPERWMLATGDKKHIYDLARKSYFAVLDEGDGGVQDFIHTENFILVDTKRRIRGYYDGTSDNDMRRLADEIRILLRETEQS